MVAYAEEVLDLNSVAKRHFYTLVLIFVLMGFTYLLSDTFFNPPWENYHTWRQSDTYSIAEIYSEKGMDLLNPEFYYDSSENQTVQLELQILPAFGLTLSSITGMDLALSLRLVSLLFFLASGIFLYLIAQLYMDEISSVFTVVLYFLAPLSTLLSRAIMPEALAMFFYLGAVYFFLLWYRGQRNLYALISAGFLAFAILLKLPIAFFGLAVIFMFLKKEKFQALKNPIFYFYGVIALLPSILYFAYMGLNAEASFVSGIASEHVFSEKLLGIFSLESFHSHLRILMRYFGPIILILGFGGCILSIFNKTLRREILPWAVSIFLEVLIICSIIKFDYYYIFLVPVLAMLGGIFINLITKNKVKILLALIFSGILLFNSMEVIKQSLAVNENVASIATKIAQSIDENSNFGINYYSPAHINAVGTNGARIGLDYYENVPTDREAEILYWIENDMEHFCLIKSIDSTEEFQPVLEKYGRIIYDDEELIIYKVGI